jgi:hypothetical protein
MPKKRVGVSLRKPSPAPERAPASAEAPVVSTPSVAAEVVLREATSLDVASSAAESSAVGSSPVESSAVASSAVALPLGVARQAASLEPLPAVARAAEVASGEALTTAAVSMQAAPLAAAMAFSESASAPAPVNVEAFVNGAAAAIENVASAVPAEKLQELLRRGPEGYREFTIYLPEKLADALAVFCREHDLDLSQLVATAVEQHLNAARAAAANVMASASESVLAVAARSLLGDLKGWVLSVLATRRKGFRPATA